MVSGPSLVSGWLPSAVQVGVAVLAVGAAGWRTRGWRRRRLPVALVVGVAAAIGARVWFAASGLGSSPAPLLLWVWVGVAVAAVAVAGLGWGSAGWGRRVLVGLVVPASVLCAGIVVNQWTGYVATTSQAFDQLTGAPVPGQISGDELAALRSTPQPAMSTGKVVAVSIPSTGSGFAHREEYVYLPPAWFTGPAPPSALPVIMMVGAVLSGPADWIRAGDAVATADAYAQGHRGYGPILVFVDAVGGVNHDTECVNGPHGNAADHLTGDVRPWVISHLGASQDPARWAVVGWSMGGTCAVDLGVMHPELFATFVDISGDLGPTTGTKAQTITRLYGGDAAAWAHFDPLTVLAGHPRYPGSAGWFDTTGDPAGAGRSELVAARQLCAAAAGDGIACTVHTRAGRHTWQNAARAFTDALPWITTRAASASPPQEPLQGRGPGGAGQAQRSPPAPRTGSRGTR